MTITSEPFAVAVDAMGSDDRPLPEVHGVFSALRQYPNVRIFLVGDENILRQYMKDYKNPRLEIIHTDQFIDMNEHPVNAIRKKKKASMRLAFNLVKEGKANGIVSVGNTGACMALAKLMLGTSQGVDRPALATAVPSIKGTTIILDVGANVDCKPLHLEQFAIMGSIYSKLIFEITNPRVALLSIGEEEIKGNDLIREVHQALKKIDINFVGNIEGKDVYEGDVDVVVCDGFAGNIALKISEGVISAIMYLLKRELSQTLKSKIGAILSRTAFRNLKKKIDYSEYGGAPLLGIRHPVIIGHGRSNANAVKNAIRFIGELYHNKIPQRIEEEIKGFMKEYHKIEE